MEEQYEFDQLLVAYFLKELDAEQEAFVIYSIQNDQELKRKFEEYKKLWQLLQIQKNIDAIDLGQERNRLQESVNNHKIKTLNTSQDLNTDHNGFTRPAKLYSILKAVAVAASLILVIGIGWMLLRSKGENRPAIAVANKIEESIPNLNTYTEGNTSGTSRNLILQDGTEVQLWDSSEISFSKPFAADKRDVILKGKAKFKVAKDKTKPFTVYSGEITTRALGTEFLITHYKNDHTITVRLLEGRVMVKSVDSLHKKLKNPYYLEAGQELLFNKLSTTAIVRNFRDQLNKESRKPELAVDNPSLPKNKGSWYMFNNQSLPEIFDQLESIYGVDIDYKKKELQTIYFIGQFDRSDSIEYILRNIAALNNLTLSKTNNQYTIRRKIK